MAATDGDVAAGALRREHDPRVIPGLIDANPQLASGNHAIGFDTRSVEHGRLLGRVEVLQWAQDELIRLATQWKAQDRFADTRPLEDFLTQVQDSLRAVQDGTGDPAGLVRTAAAPDVADGEADGAVPAA